MGKQKKDARKLEAAADAQNAPADAADDAADATATGQAAEAGTGDAAAGDEKPADAKDAGQVQGAADAGADAADAEGAQPDEGERVSDGQAENNGTTENDAGETFEGADNSGSGGRNEMVESTEEGDQHAELGDSLLDGGDQAEVVRAPMTIARFARELSSVAAVFAGRQPVAVEWFAWDDVFDAEEAELMADFVLENPDAPLLAMYKHLEIQKRLPATTPNNADMMALSVFRHACLAALEFLRAEQADLAKPVPQSAGWPGEQALQVTHSPFEATGFTPSR